MYVGNPLACCLFWKKKCRYAWLPSIFATIGTTKAETGQGGGDCLGVGTVWSRILPFKVTFIIRGEQSILHTARKGKEG